MNTSNTIKTGRYKHFKGKEYIVIGVGRHSETLEEFVIYRACYESPEFGKDALWIRPASMFFEHVEKDGYCGPRFIYLGD